MKNQNHPIKKSKKKRKRWRKAGHFWCLLSSIAYISTSRVMIQRILSNSSFRWSYGQLCLYIHIYFLLLWRLPRLHPTLKLNWSSISKLSSIWKLYLLQLILGLERNLYLLSQLRIFFNEDFFLYYARQSTK